MTAVSPSPLRPFTELSDSERAEPGERRRLRWGERTDALGREVFENLAPPFARAAAGFMIRGSD